MCDWSKRTHRDQQALETRRKGAVDYLLVRTFDCPDCKGEHYFLVINAPHPVADPKCLSSEFTEAERLFTEQTK